MRSGLVALMAILLTSPAWAQGATSATPSREPAPLNLPISLDRIREALSQPAPAEPLKGLNAAEQPTFRVDITEQQRLEELLAKIRFEQPGPQIAGGIDAYEQQQRLFPRISNPLAQPYGAFTTGQVATLAAEALIEKYVAERVAQLFEAALREQAEREAREEVARVMATLPKE